MFEYERNINADRKLQLVYWVIENLKANEDDEALITTLNLMENFCHTEGMYKTLRDNWEKIEEEGIEETERLLPLYYGNMCNR